MIAGAGGQEFVDRVASVFAPAVPVMHADRKIRQLMAERRSIYNQVTELTNRIKQQAQK